MILVDGFFEICDRTRDILAPIEIFDMDFIIGGNRMERTARAICMLLIGSGAIMFPLAALSVIAPKAALIFGAGLAAVTVSLVAGMLAHRTWALNLVKVS